MQTITFTAPSGGELRQQMLDFLGITYSAPPVRLAADTADDVKKVNEVPDVKTRGKKADKIPQGFVPQAQETSPEPQGSGAPASPLQSVDQETQAFDRQEPVTAPIPEQEVVTPPKEMLELKEKVIDALQAAFRAGKVSKVRSVLSQYGNGAKSFREIDIQAFPRIDQALQHGALN